MLAGCFSLSAQNYFESLIDIDSMPGAFGGVEYVNGNYFVIGNNLNSTTNRQELTLTKIDFYGNTQWTKIYGDTLEHFEGKLIISKDDHLFLFGTYRDTTMSPRKTFVSRFDTSGNQQWIKYFSKTNYDETIAQALITSNNNFLLVISGKETNNTYIQPSLLNIDTAGNLIWHETYGKQGVSDWAGSAVELNNGKFLVAGVSKQVSNTMHQYLFCVDSNGTLLWDTVHANTNDENLSYISNLYQNDFFLLSNDYNISATEDNISLRDIDGNGDEVWMKDYVIKKRSKLRGAIKNEDGTILCIGTSQDPIGADLVLLMQITPRGDTIWTRNYNKETGFPNYIWDIVIDSGNYVCVGQAYNPLTNSYDGWIKKLDCMGCDSVQCYFPDSCFVYDCNEDYPPVANFTLAEDSFYYYDGDSIPIKFENGSSASAAYTWFFDTGDSLNLVNPDYTFYQPGDYEITLVARNLECTDTAKAILHIVDVTGVESLASEPNGLIIYPNPAEGEFRAQVPFENTAQMEFGLYDGLGRSKNVVYIIQNGEVAVDCRKLSPGLYFITLQNEGVVLKGNVVVK